LTVSRGKAGQMVVAQSLCASVIFFCFRHAQRVLALVSVVDD
jgi:hypothetical protein